MEEKFLMNLFKGNLMLVILNRFNICYFLLCIAFIFLILSNSIVYSQDNITQLIKKSDINKIIFGEEDKNDVVDFEKDYEEPTPDLSTILSPSGEVQEKSEDDWLNDIIDDI